MDLIHIGLVSQSEERANHFFGDLLGLEMTRRSALPQDVARLLFGFDESCEMLYFGNESLMFEVFLTGWAEQTPKKITHSCIEVEDRSSLLARASAEGYEVREAPRQDYSVFFLVDLDGNLFEVKERR
jgi:catechol 2,3-dioxygenase-like lactoylglutathione lyase family enzyme